MSSTEPAAKRRKVALAPAAASSAQAADVRTTPADVKFTDKSVSFTAVVTPYAAKEGVHRAMRFTVPLPCTVLELRIAMRDQWDKSKIKRDFPFDSVLITIDQEGRAQYHSNNNSDAKDALSVSGLMYVHIATAKRFEKDQKAQPLIRTTPTSAPAAASASAVAKKPAAAAASSSTGKKPAEASASALAKKPAAAAAASSSTGKKPAVSSETSRVEVVLNGVSRVLTFNVKSENLFWARVRAKAATVFGIREKRLFLLDAKCHTVVDKDKIHISAFPDDEIRIVDGVKEMEVKACCAETIFDLKQKITLRPAWEYELIDGYGRVLALDDLVRDNTRLHIKPRIIEPNLDMQIFIRGLQGELNTLTVAPDFTIDAIKEMIHHKKGIPPDQQRLSYGSRTLNALDTLGHHCVERNTVFDLTLRLRGS